MDIKTLRETTRYVREGEPITYAWGRIFSIYFTKLFLYTPLTANHVTWISCFVGVAGVLLWSVDSLAWKIAGLACMQMAFILDLTDGEVARARKQTSARGVFYDLVSHLVIHQFVFVGLMIHGWQAFQDAYILLLGFLAGTAFTLSTVVRTLGFRVAVEAKLSVAFKETGSGSTPLLLIPINFFLSFFGIQIMYAFFTAVHAWLGNGEVLRWLILVNLLGYFLILSLKSFLQVRKIGKTLAQSSPHA